jgi:hypothetical protein
MNSGLPIRAIGIPWYELEDYERVKTVMEDGHLLPNVYSLWRLKAEQAERQLRRQGNLVVRAHLRADEFAAWCKSRGLNIDAKARTQFASDIALQEHGKTH